MASELFPASDPPFVDLTGFPEGMTQRIKQLVRLLRAGPASNSPRDELLPLIISRPRPSAVEVDLLLDELSAGLSLKLLPLDFSRADLYDDHD